MISPNFMCGVLEGFYGRPWTPDQRVELFDLVSSLGLNAYMYAPKDDLKHRAYWRELYSVEEAEHLTALIQAAKENNIQFIYALSPGLDITFSNSKEVTCLKRKLEQVKQFGVEAFALLFDDIDTDMCVADKEVFQSFAHAQVSITNEVYQHLGQPKFLFCPTEYCATRADPNVKNSEYLTTVGKKLLPDIDFMWTGPKVISKVISLESIKELSSVILRKPVIWDNIHANDYDQKRIFLGPFKGRSTDLLPYLSGIFTNPNCEFEVNFIALHTLAAWSRSFDAPVDRKKGTQASGVSGNPVISADIKLEQEGDNESDLTTNEANHGSYDPDTALQRAISDWMVEIMDNKTASGKLKRRRTAVPANILGPNPPPLPGVNTCMSTTSTTSTEGASPTPNLPLAEEIRKNKEAFDNLADLVGANSGDPENFRPPIAVNAINSLVAKPEDALEPMECNGDMVSKATVVVPTKSSSLMQLCTTTDSKVSDMSMQIDENMDKDSPSPKAQSSELLCPAAGTDSSSDSAQDSEMQIDSTGDDPDKPGPSGVLISELTASKVKDAEKSKAEGDMEEVEADLKPACPLEEKLTEADVLLLVELFYLPYEHGPRAVAMLEEVHWLKTNAFCVCVTKQSEKATEKAVEWRERATKFVQYSKEVHSMMTRLLNIPNRSLLYYLYPYIWDMEGILSLLASFIKWLENGLVSKAYCSYLDNQYTWCSKNHKEAFMSGDLEPWVFRGGLTGEFQRMLPLEGATDLFCKTPHKILSVVYTIRPYLPKDEAGVYKVCLQTCDDGVDGTEIFPDKPDLIGDKLVGHFLTLSPEYCFVLEESDQIVGYILATLDAKSFYKKVEMAWIEEMKLKYPKPTKTTNLTPSEEIIQGFHTFSPYLPEKLHERFPSLLRMDLLPSVDDKGVGKNMLACALSALKANGSQGAFVEVCTGDKNHLEAYTKLGFFEVPELEPNQDDVHIVARAI